MTPEQILAIPPRVLTQAQREFYFRDGYLLVEKIIGDDWLAQAARRDRRAGRAQRAVTKSDTIFDLEPGHRPSRRACAASRRRSTSIRCSGSTSRSRSWATSSPTSSGPTSSSTTRS